MFSHEFEQGHAARSSQTCRTPACHPA
jgi:hypothetical protein